MGPVRRPSPGPIQPHRVITVSEPNTETGRLLIRLVEAQARQESKLDSVQESLRDLQKSTAANAASSLARIDSLEKDVQHVKGWTAGVGAGAGGLAALIWNWVQGG